LPGNDSRAIAYAAAEAIVTASSVEINPIPIELRSADVNVPSLKMSE
jgi:hypothetical protein